MSTLSELKARVDEASGPNGELDEAVALALCDEHRFMQLKDAPEGVGCEMYRIGDHGFGSALRVTASIDAALALVGWVLPGWSVSIDIGDGCEVCLSENGGKFLISGDREFYGRHATPPIAILSAMLAALSSAEQTANPDLGMNNHD